MEILFGQHFDQGYYLDYSLPENQHIFNKLIVGPMGLLNILERDMGLMGIYLQPLERRVHYQGMLTRSIIEHPGNLFEKSFAYDPDGVTEELLKYRDQLVLAGWHKDVAGISPKIDFLAEIEAKFMVPVGTEDRWIKVLNRIETSDQIAFEFKSINIAEDSGDLHPFFKRLFDVLERKGVVPTRIEFDFQPDPQSNLGKIKSALMDKSIKVKLDVADKISIQILRFKSDSDAAEFVASQYKALKDSVIINRNSSLFDEMLNSFGLPVAGSEQANANPLLIQLIRLIAVLLVKPLHIHNLMSYLQVEVNPIPASLRYQLLKVIKETGGIRNPEWDQTIENFEYASAVHKKEILNFLQIRESSNDRINCSDTISLYRSLEEWAQKRLILKLNEPVVSAQLAYLLNMCKAVVGVLEARQRDTISSVELGLIINGVYEPSNFINYEAQVGSCRVVGVPGQLISSPKSCIWLDCYNEEMVPAWYDFLNSTETDHLKNNQIQIWETTDQTRSTADSLMLGLMRPIERCTIIISEKAGGEPVTDHPVFSMLRSLIPSIEDFIVDASSLSTKRLVELGWTVPATLDWDTVAFPEKKLVHQISNGELVPDRQTESASSIELLIPSPFDWVLHYSAKIQPGYSYQLDDLAITKGNVAHKLIEVLFTRAGKDNTIARNLMAGYDALLQEITDGYGMLLLLDENRFEYERFRTSLRTATNTLLNLLDENRLTVTGTETKMKAKLPSLGDQVLEGTIDLIIKTPEGENAIFDMKWSRKPRKYVDLMKENKHIQLAIYKELLQTAETLRVDFVAYYSLSNARLITAKPLRGSCVTILDGIQSEVEILTRVHNAVAFRRNQIRKGIIEEGEGMEINDLDYYLEQDSQNMMALDVDTGKKKVNPYSSYTVFKGDVI